MLSFHYLPPIVFPILILQTMMARSHHVLANLLPMPAAFEAIIIAIIASVLVTLANSSCCNCNAFATLQTTRRMMMQKQSPRPRHRIKSLALYTTSASSSSSRTTSSNILPPSLVQATLPKTYDRTTAQEMVRQTLCPSNEERDRNTAGMEAYNTGAGTGNDDKKGPITSDDPRGEYTYDEFPLDSFDLLVDRALDFVVEEDCCQSMNMVDLGSGCGRIVFYAALSRGLSEFKSVHGVEIGTQLHTLAVNSLKRGVEHGWFEEEESCPTSSDDDNEERTNNNSRIAFHNGNALLVDDPYYPKNTHGASSSQEADTTTEDNIQSILSNTNLLFAYSTVYETNKAQPFNPELQAMILSPKWSQTLASVCSEGCVAITTDRALNPKDGWRLVDRMDVENPSVWGSVGYISVLEK